MKLKKLIVFTEFKHLQSANKWTIKGVTFDDLNLIVGSNAAGKTRLTNIISNLAFTISNTRKPAHGYWDLIFATDEGEELQYTLDVNASGHVIEENIKNITTDKVLLTRNKNKKELFSLKSNAYQSIEPPQDQLTVGVRRDKVDYPYLEELYNWADNLYSFKIASLLPESLAAVPDTYTGDPLKGGFDFMALTYGLLSEKSKLQLLSDFNKLDFQIDAIKVQKIEAVTFPVKSKFLHWQEHGVAEPIPQHQISNGMLRAFNILLILEYVKTHDTGQAKTIIIDDFSDGLDYSRADILKGLIQEKSVNKKIQLILTSNSQVLMNGIDVMYWNILVRTGSEVRSFNYENSKAKFDKFKSTGLNNFALFTSDFLES